MCAAPEELCPSFRAVRIKRSSCSALFGEAVRVGLASSLPLEVLSKLDNEEDLAVIMDPPSASAYISSSALLCQ